MTYCVSVWYFFALIKYTEHLTPNRCHHFKMLWGHFRNLGLGLGLSRFGNSSYQETQISILGAKSYIELVQHGISLNMYQLSISNYGQAEAIGSKVSVRYAMGTHVETMLSLLNGIG